MTDHPSPPSDPIPELTVTAWAYGTTKIFVEEDGSHRVFSESTVGFADTIHEAIKLADELIERDKRVARLEAELYDLRVNSIDRRSKSRD